MIRRAINLLCALALLCAIVVAHSPAASAQASGSVSGTVSTPEGDPLADICTYLVDDDWNQFGSESTGPDGPYAFSGAPTGIDLRVYVRDCSPDPTFVEQWSPTFSLEPDAELTGVDLVMEAGGFVVGRVLGPDGDPIEGACVDVVAAHGAGGDPYLGGADTRADGSYRVGPVASGSVKLRVEDCADVGPFLRQWFDGASSWSTATAFAVVAGQDVVLGDVRLERASVIEGAVSGPDGAPLADVCVQAVGSDAVGGSARSEGDGTYRMAVGVSGGLQVQFVDCSDDPVHAGRWYGGGAERSSAAEVVVAPGETVEGISVQLELGAPASLGGRVTNVRGEAMTDVCVALYLADEFVDFRVVDQSGRYDFVGFGSGSWALAYIGCGDEDDDGPDAQMNIEDPVVEGVRYRAQWRGGVPLLLEHRDAPDPVAQGAELLEVPAGAELVADQCFGCGSVRVSAVLDGSSVRADFELVGVTSDAPVDFELSCESTTGVGVAGMRSTSGGTSPLQLDGLAPATGYDCVVTAAVRGAVVARSDADRMATAGGSTPSPGPADPAGSTAPRTDASGPPRPRALSFTG